MNTFTLKPSYYRNGQSGQFTGKVKVFEKNKLLYSVSTKITSLSKQDALENAKKEIEYMLATNKFSN